MLVLRRFIFVVIIITALAGAVLAQSVAQAGKSSSISAGVDVAEIRIEVYSPSGELVYDSGQVAGSSVEWNRLDQKGRAVAEGVYVVSVRAVTAEGKARNRVEQVVVGKESRGSKLRVEAASLGASGVSTAAAEGTGTPGRLAKWVSDTTLGDSSLMESEGKLGVGTDAPTAQLHVEVAQPAESSTNNGTNAGMLLQTSGGKGGNTTGAGKTAGTGASISLIAGNGGDAPPGATRGKGGTITIQPGSSGSGGGSGGKPGNVLIAPLNVGNVAIGTNNPTSRLTVAGGDIQLVSNGKGIKFADGTLQTTAATTTGEEVLAKINDPANITLIGDNRLSSNVARLNGTNTWTGPNTFSAGLSAGGALVANVGTPALATDAANKGYVDSNFVKFVPGAEQLSVGDANGTATMINLRGGSTCCSGPGGHTPAFFKVFQNGSFVATGNLGIGVSPMEGKGYRTSWHTYKGAFRSGYADTEWDDANVGFFSWAGGSNSTASGLYALAFGDTNFARSTSSIAFGSGNEVKGAAGFSAGAGNRVCDTYGVALGNNARSGGPYIDGKCDPETFNIRGLAAVAIGYNVTADQDHTMALGKFASNNGFQGTFIWSDGAPQASADTFRNTANNEFAARATGGFRFRTNLGGTTGCNLPAGSGVFNCTSSRTTKENFAGVNGEDVLSSLRKISVSTWNYISEGRQVRHMGPMAEDFYQAFGLGTGNKSIGVQDLAGVSLAAVKALEQRTSELQQKTSEVERLAAEVKALRAANEEMESRLARLEQAMQSNAAEKQQKD